ncbi:MAG TPA: hypothetical protein VMF90_19900 [Rhizobiaceae bacterium]|nr:hypothetical protein [Rhizobiaceae bacterium]
MADVTKTTLFKAKIPARDKAEQTTFVARSIMDAETAAQEKKTARLKALRLEQEARQAAEEAAAPPKAPATKAKPKKK